MVTVAVVTILIGLSMPWYGDYVRQVEVSQGLRIALPAKTRSTELVILGDTQEGLDSSELDHSPVYALPPNPNSPQVAYMPVQTTQATTSSWEESDSSSGKVKNVVRSGTVVVVTFTSELDRFKITEYYLVLFGKVETSSISWTCKEDSTITAMVDELRNRGAPVGSMPLPRNLLPGVCQG